jgi:hypothetical protein
MIVNDASTINVIDDASLALASVVNYDRKWRYNLEHHFDDTRSVNYDCNTFIIQATDFNSNTETFSKKYRLILSDLLKKKISLSFADSDKKIRLAAFCPVGAASFIFRLELKQVQEHLCSKTETFLQCNLSPR